MAAKFPSVAGKTVLVVVVVAMIALLFTHSADAGEVVAPLQQDNPQCNLLVKVSPDCDTWCTDEGHPGGYVKGDACCCNSGGLLAVDS